MNPYSTVLETLSRWRSRETDFSSMPIWKVVPLALVLFVLMIVLVFVPYLVVQGLTSGRTEDVLTPLVSIVFVLVAYRVLTALLGRPSEYFYIRRPDRSVLPWLAFGIALPLALYLITFVGRDPSVNVASVAATTILLFVVMAVLEALLFSILEEYMFRGFLLKILSEKWNWTVGIVITSILFGFSHNARGDTELGMWLMIGSTAIAGCMMALVVYRTRNVWAAVAIHAAWNTLHSPLLILVGESTMDIDETLLTVTFAEPSVIYEGTEAILHAASPVAIVVLSLVTIVLLVDTLRRPTDVVQSYSAN